MRLQQLIPNTVALWQGQNTLVDTSGNGLDLAVNAGSVAYEQMDPCIRGITFNGSLDLIAPSTDLLRFAGEFTIQAIFIPRTSNDGTFFQCEAAQVLYAWYINSGDAPAFADQGVNTALLPLFDWVNLYAVPGHDLNEAFFMTCRRRLVAGNYIADIRLTDKNGVVTMASIAASHNTPAGTERLRIGGFSGGASFHGAFSSIRIISFARADADDLADAAWALSGSCTPIILPRGAQGGYGSESY